MIPSHRKKSKSNRTFLLAARGKNVFKIGTLTAFFIAKSGYDFANPKRYLCRKTVENARMTSDFFVWLSIPQYLMKKRSTCPETFIEKLDTVFSLRMYTNKHFFGELLMYQTLCRNMMDLDRTNHDLFSGNSKQHLVKLIHA